MTHTSSAAADHEGRVACLSTQTEDQNPTSSLQRTLATSDEDQLAALHRIETYASPAAAQQVFANRSTALSSCDEIPARIVRATSVEGMGDEAFQISVVFEDVPIQYHTLLMTRVGSAIQLLDVARTSSPVEAQLAADALARPQGTLCTIEAATCAPEPTITDAVVPAAEPVGWLIPSDLPRIRPGVRPVDGLGPHRPHERRDGVREPDSGQRARPHRAAAGHLPDDAGRPGAGHVRRGRAALHVPGCSRRHGLRHQAGQRHRQLQGPRQHAPPSASCRR